MEPSPKILYKYRPLSGNNFKFTHNIFINNELYFSHPDQFNDPFDCKIPPNLKNVTKEQMLKYIENINSEKFAKVGIDLVKAKQFINNKPISELRVYFSDKFKSYLNMGVLSLSELEPCNKKNVGLAILMWSHYTDSHQGICIGFDYNKLLFGFNNNPCIPDNVKYPPANEYNWNPFTNNEKEITDKIFFTKASCWEYEQEWRVVLPEKPRTLQKFNPDALVSVHLGCKIGKDKETVINWCLQRNLKPKIYETKINELSYLLKEYEIVY
ncbi:MAG: DUF2971 domain-containing protein [Phycisphaerae bacterium]